MNVVTFKPLPNEFAQWWLSLSLPGKSLYIFCSIPEFLHLWQQSHTGAPVVMHFMSSNNDQFAKGGLTEWWTYGGKTEREAPKRDVSVKKRNSALRGRFEDSTPEGDGVSSSVCHKHASTVFVKLLSLPERGDKSWIKWQICLGLNVVNEDTCTCF